MLRNLQYDDRKHYGNNCENTRKTSILKQIEGQLNISNLRLGRGQGRYTECTIHTKIQGSFWLNNELHCNHTQIHNANTD